MKNPPKEQTVNITRTTPLGKPITVPYPHNSNAVKKAARAGKVVWTGGTKYGKF